MGLAEYSGLCQDSVRRGGLHPGLISFSPYGREWRVCIVVSHSFAKSAKGGGNRYPTLAAKTKARRGWGTSASRLGGVGARLRRVLDFSKDGWAVCGMAKAKP